MRSFSLACLVLLAFCRTADSGEVFVTRTLAAGTIVSMPDLSTNDEEARDLSEEMVGLEVRRAIYAGHRIVSSDLGPPTLVRRNEVVVMTYRSGALGLRAEGRAMSAGGVGEVVDVMNLSSKRTVRAVVTGRRQVEIHR